MARLADNTFGQILRDHAAAEGIDLALAPYAMEPTSLAIVSIDAEAKPCYDFYLDGTADWHWTSAEMARLGSDSAVLHFGSIASWTTPGSEHIHAAVSAQYAGGQTLISYDPNVRPLLMGDPMRSRITVEASVGCPHIAKASREDLDWLYPGTGIEHVAARWRELGALLVVITDGSEGAHAYPTAGAPIHRPGRRVRVVDTVGAGDAFTAGLLSALVRRSLIVPKWVSEISADVLVDVIDEAILVASLSCERVGADPPSAVRRPNAHEKLSSADLQLNT
jgi:fructokinase